MDPRLARDYAAWGFDRRAWSARTRTAYRRRIVVWHRFCVDHGRPFIRAGEDDVAAWVTTLPATPNSRNLARKALVSFYDYLIDARKRTTNPAGWLPRMREPAPPPRALTVDQAAAMLAASGAHGPAWTAWLSLAFYGGLRSREIRLRQWSDLHDGWVDFDAKGGQRRTLPLHANTLVALERWQAECGSPRWLFPSPTGRDQPWSESWQWKQLRVIGQAAGIDGFHAHLARHTFATGLLGQGVNVRVVQELLGHRSLGTTQRYVSVRSPQLAEAVAALP